MPDLVLPDTMFHFPPPDVFDSVRSHFKVKFFQACQNKTGFRFLIGNHLGINMIFNLKSRMYIVDGSSEDLTKFCTISSEEVFPQDSPSSV